MAAAPPGDSRGCAGVGGSGAGGWRGSSLSRPACQQARIAATASAPTMAPATRLTPKFNVCRMIIAVSRTNDGHRASLRSRGSRRGAGLSQIRLLRPCTTRSSRSSSHLTGIARHVIVCLFATRAGARCQRLCRWRCWPSFQACRTVISIADSSSARRSCCLLGAGCDRPLQPAVRNGPRPNRERHRAVVGVEGVGVGCGIDAAGVI
jgi:hypothetical protein